MHGWEDARRHAITVTDAGAVYPSDPHGRGSYARAENPVVRFVRTMLWPCGPGSPRGPQWCSDEATSQRCGLTGENLVAAACQEVTGYRQSAASQSASRSIARSRICGEGGISGMGGCKIGSRRGLGHAGNAGPRSAWSGSSDGTAWLCRSASLPAKVRCPAARSLIHWSIPPGDWPRVRVRSLRWAAGAGSGSAERSGAKYWPGWRRRSSASAATASWRWARVALSQSARSAIVWANTVSRCR